MGEQCRVLRDPVTEGPGRLGTCVRGVPVAGVRTRSAEGPRVSWPRKEEEQTGEMGSKADGREAGEAGRVGRRSREGREEGGPGRGQTGRAPGTCGSWG